MAEKTFTGLTRKRKTPRSVRTAETTARIAISMGGIGTIVAILLIFVFLLGVAIPLFEDAEAERLPLIGTPAAEEAQPIITAGTDDFQLMAWVLHADGRLLVRRVADGKVVDDRTLFKQLPTAWSFSPDGPECAFAFADGSIQTGKIEFQETYLEPDAVPAEARKLRPGGSTRHQNGILSVTPLGQFRFDSLVVALEEPVKATDSAIRLLDYSITPGGSAFAYLTESDKLSISSFESHYDMFQDKDIVEVYEKPLVYHPPAGRGRPSHLKLSGIANTLFLVWDDGHCLRFDAREAVLAAGGEFEIVEVVELLKDGGRVVDKVEYIVGKTTFLVADDRGTLTAWFPTRPPDAYARDGILMAAAHVLPPEDGSTPRVTTIVPSRRSRIAAVGYDDGTVRVYQITNETELLSVSLEKREPVAGLALAPKKDGLIAFASSGYQRWQMNLGHPEATLQSLFGKVWYEGALGPDHVWQSEGGSDDFEPKLGLVKLIFGTVKATLYSMLIAIPIALLAAIYTSEFLTPRWRAPLKSVIEMMASLPSVVLGFLAAIVLAPFVENVLITVLCTFIMVPLMVIIGARLWQFLPTNLAVRWSGMPRLVAICLTIPLGIALGSLVAPGVERLCFAGDVDGWLNGTVGSVAGGWAFLLIPACMILTAIALGRFLGPWLRTASTNWSRAQLAVTDLVRFAAVVGGGILLAWGLGALIGTGADPRNSIVGEYQPRNAMIVGFVMGFAIVPIIYTLAEDALSSVPRELREGSLGCGATQWQTSMRIVVPAAMSGLFSAMMVGLGRAVGETMIVLMAAGNTAIMDLNVFNGFRTLSANIATELPEAVKGSAHYRILFLAGLVLFAMTFFLNTIAEMVRRHFRGRFQEM